MAGHGEKLTRRQEAAIAALLTRPTVEAAAAECGVGYSTLKGWLAQPGFRAEYAAARRRLVDRAVLVLQQATTRAVGTLVRHLEADRPADAISAAKTVLDQAFRGMEILDLAAEVQSLREEVEAIRHERDRGIDPPRHRQASA
jgi:hypothetical protein